MVGDIWAQVAVHTQVIVGRRRVGVISHVCNQSVGSFPSLLRVVVVHPLPPAPPAHSSMRPWLYFGPLHTRRHPFFGQAPLLPSRRCTAGHGRSRSVWVVVQGRSDGQGVQRCASRVSGLFGLIVLVWRKGVDQWAPVGPPSLVASALGCSALLPHCLLLEPFKAAPCLPDAWRSPLFEPRVALVHLSLGVTKVMHRSPEPLHYLRTCWPSWCIPDVVCQS